MAEELEMETADGSMIDILTILTELGLQSLYPRFEENKVGPKEVESLSQEEFLSLGVQAIGDRARLKQRCKDFIKGKSLDSCAIQKYIQLSTRSSNATCKNKRKGKMTRKMYVGWKHTNANTNTFSLVHPSKGGGQRVKDIPKDTSLQELEQIILDEYFPQGICLSAHLKCEDVVANIVSFSGHPLPETVGDSPFTVGSYCDSRKSNPIRIYLQTKKKTAVFETQMKVKEDDRNSEDDFEMEQFVNMGTPTVNLNRRGPNRLSLTKAREASCSSTSQLPVNGRDLQCQENLPSVSSHDSFNLTQECEAPRTKSQLPANGRDLQCQENLPSGSGMSLVTDTTAGGAVYMIESDNDTELEAAIKESLKEKPTFEKALGMWVCRTLREAEPVEIIANRNNIVDSLKRAQRRPSFTWLSPVKIIFSGELGEDFGGPKREFFSLLMKEVKQLVGENGSLQHSISKLENNDFYQAGKWIVWSVLQGGEACQFLSANLLEMILGSETLELSIDDVSDVELKEYLVKLSEAEIEDEIPSDWLLDIGISPPFNMAKKQKLLQLALKQVSFYRIHAEISQLREGLSCFSFLETMREYKEGLQSLLCVSFSSRLSLCDFKKMLSINYSPEGSNRRREEEDSIYALELFIQDCCDDLFSVTEEDILSFWTGSSRVPPLGWEKKLEVNFTEGQDRLPVAHTCDMSIEIPRGMSPEALSKKMLMALQWGGQFHLV